jgi:NAD(P)-dependent dehydrogenase (short-subunit alcohol dehydrogenase family)
VALFLMANILISGGNGGLGKVVVDYFVSKGHTVLAIVSPGKSPKESSNLFYYEANLTDEAQTSDMVQSVITKHNSIDAALLLAGGFAMGSIEDTDWKAITAMLDINFKTAFTVARPVFSHMVNGVGGKIVFIGARPALDVKSGKAMLAYTLSKSMVLNLAEILNAEAADKSVQCSVVVPSTIDTPKNRADMPQADFSKWNKPEDIAVLLEKIATGNEKTESVIKL